MNFNLSEYKIKNIGQLGNKIDTESTGVTPTVDLSLEIGMIRYMCEL